MRQPLFDIDNRVPVVAAGLYNEQNEKAYNRRTRTNGAYRPSTEAEVLRNHYAIDILTKALLGRF